jgi:hypothetical protein
MQALVGIFWVPASTFCFFGLGYPLNQSHTSSDMPEIKDSSLMDRYESICIIVARWAMMCCSECSRAGDDLHRAVMTNGGLLTKYCPV